MPTPIDVPAGICVTDCVLRPVNAVGVQTSPFTLRRSVQVFPGQRWEMDWTFLPQERADAAVIEAFLLSLRGAETTVRAGDPFRSSPRGTPAGTPGFDLASSTAGAAAIGSRGWTPSATGVLLANDLIQLGDQLFAVLDDVDADVSGEAEIPVWPNLRALATDGAPITTTNPRGVFSLASQPSFARDRLELYTAATVQLVEVIA